MEHYKTYCQSHPYESVTNFCADPHCLVGLCATCICEHTQQHLKRGSPPQYENIKSTFARYNERMREQIDRVEQDKEWLGTVCGKIEERRQAVRTVLGRAREDCLALVGRHFDDLEQKIESEIANEAKKNSLHCQYRLETLASLMVKEVGSLLLYAKDLASPKFLETVQRVEQEVFPNSADFHLRVSRELKENEVYAANVVYREDLLTDINLCLKRLVSLEFLLPRVECVEERARGNSAKKSASLMLSASQPNFSRVRNVSAVVSPAKQSFLMAAPPVQQILSPSMLRMQTENINKASRLSSCLKVIRESRRENNQDEVRSITSSSVSCDKENDLAHSTYCDTGSNFFR